MEITESQAGSYKIILDTYLMEITFERNRKIEIPDNLLLKLFDDG